MKTIVLLSSENLEGYIHDDPIFIQALEQMNFKVRVKPWESFVDDGEDLFLIRTTWNYTEHLDLFLSTLQKIQNRLWNPYSLVQWNCNKKYLLDLQAQGLPVMPLTLVNDSQSLEKAMDDIGGDDFILKPLVSASAKGLVRFRRENKPRVDQQMILQKFYPQIHGGEVSFIFFAGKLAYVVQKTPVPGEIRVQEEYGGVITAYEPTVDQRQQALAVAERIPKPWLYARVDMVPDVGVIEVECIEPSLYFSTHKNSGVLFAQAVSDLFGLEPDSRASKMTPEKTLEKTSGKTP